MNKIAAALQTKTVNFAQTNPGVLQRQCACGNHTAAGGECTECSTKKTGLQRKLTIGASNDPLEREADRIADQVMAAPMHSAVRNAPPRIQRFSGQSNAETAEAPVSVDQALASPGRPLEPTLRQDMEQRFGHDFSRVRVHSGEAAEQSARDVNAHAYTVGRDIVFGAGRFAPGTHDGRRLIAHELTHVIQQTATGLTIQAELGVGERNNPTEREADDMARHVMEGTPAGPIRPDSQTLRRGGGAIDIELVPVAPEGRKENENLGIDLPKVSEGVWRIIGGVADNAKKSLIEPEKRNIETILKNAKIPTGNPLASPLGGRFLLHDTSSPVGPAAIQAQQTKGRGPLGSGISAYVPAQGDATITRPDFFETKRPSTTEFEKNIEGFKQSGDAKLSLGKQVELWKKRRDDLFRSVWNATQPSKQDGAFKKALLGMQLTPTEIQEERTGNNKKRSDPDFNPGIEAVLKAGSTEKVTTSTSWAIEEICKEVNPKTISSIAISGREKDLTAACAALSGYFVERDLRVSSMVPVEIVQPGVKKGAKNMNTCDPSNPDIAPLSNPPYSAEQYKNICLLYLRASYMAGVFPEITTHYAVDGFIQGHCDPRCFDLDHLYDVIAATIGHGKGCTYGIKPIYGIPWKTHNVWWDDNICHGKHL